MKKLIFISVPIILLVLVIFRSTIFDFYYTSVYQDEVTFADSTIVALSNDEYEQIKKRIGSNSKLKSDEILNAISMNLKKVDLESKKVRRVSLLEDDATSSLVEIVNYYNNNPEAQIRFLLNIDNKTGAFKIKDIFFNDAFFMN